MAKLKHYNRTDKHRRRDKTRNKYSCCFLNSVPKSYTRPYIESWRAKSNSITRRLILDPSLEDMLDNHRTFRGTALWDYW